MTDDFLTPFSVTTWPPDQEFAAFDLETTGLYPDRDRITEICVVIFTLRETRAFFETLVDPQIPISRDASRVSGLTDEMVRGKPSILSVLPEFLAFIGDRPLVAHNAKFDMGFVNTACARLGLPRVENPVFDTRRMAKSILRHLPGYSLERVLVELRLPFGRLHRAKSDAVACRDIFITLLNRSLSST